MNSAEAIKELLEIEAWAEGLRDKCHKARLLFQEAVSTASTEGKVDPKIVAEAVAKRRRRIIKT